MPYCAACGSPNEDEANFCYSCGNQMATTRTEANPPLPPPAPPLPVETPQPSNATPEQSDADTFIAVGANGQIELSGNRIKISRKGAMGFLTQGFKGDKEILIAQISSIQLKEPNMLSRGFIQFAFIGGRESKGGLYASVRDENSVLFDKKSHPTFEELKRRIDAIRDTVNLSESGPTQLSPPTWGLDELERLASFHDRGIITDEEFETKKKEILGL